MQIENWNDFRYLLAVKRGRSLVAAARRTGVHDTTVSRRLAALQSVAGAPLCERLPNGALQLTALGEAVGGCVEKIEHQVDLIAEILRAEQEAIAGSVRLTSVPVLVNRLLTPHVGRLLSAHPALEIELIPESRDLSLTHREADLAIRLARPVTGGTHVKARRIGWLHFAEYASREFSAEEAAGLPWITYDATMAHLPQAQWIAKATKGRTDGLSALRVHDAETAIEAALAGLGRTLLPTAIADQEDRLRRLESGQGSGPPSREVWLLAHADLLELRRIRAVIDWIERLVKSTAMD